MQNSVISLIVRYKHSIHTTIGCPLHGINPTMICDVMNHLKVLCEQTTRVIDPYHHRHRHHHHHHHQYHHHHSLIHSSFIITIIIIHVYPSFLLSVSSNFT